MNNRFLSLGSFFLMIFVCSSQAVADRIGLIVPVRGVYPGQAVSDVALINKKFYIRNEAASLYVTEIGQVENKVARRTLIAGRPITLSSLANPLVVNRGQSARIVFLSGDLKITALGVVLEPGSAGDFVRVRNIDSGRVITGQVQDDGNVRVGIQ